MLSPESGPGDLCGFTGSHLPAPGAATCPPFPAHCALAFSSSRGGAWVFSDLSGATYYAFSSASSCPWPGQSQVKYQEPENGFLYFNTNPSDDNGFKTHRLLLYKQLAILYFLSKSIVFLPCIRSHISASLSVFLCSSSFLSFNSSWDPEIQICFLNTDVGVSPPRPPPGVQVYRIFLIPLTFQF